MKGGFSGNRWHAGVDLMDANAGTDFCIWKYPTYKAIKATFYFRNAIIAFKSSGRTTGVWGGEWNLDNRDSNQV